MKFSNTDKKTKEDKSSEKRNKKDEKNEEINEKDCEKSKKTNEINIDYKSKFMRVSADFQNFKKRVEKERSEWMAIAQAEVILKFLSFADDLDRAIQACEKLDVDKEKMESWLEGFRIIQKKLIKIFSELQIEEIDCSGNFNPKFHEALLQVEEKDKKSGQIVEVVHKGYSFKGNVLKHAKVVVAK